MMREPDTPNWQPYSIKRLLRMVRDLVFVNETHELGEDSETCEPIIARAERRIDEMLAARRETRPVNYDPVRDQDPLIAEIAIIMIRYKELERLEEKLICALTLNPLRISFAIRLRGTTRKTKRYLIT